MSPSSPPRRWGDTRLAVRANRWCRENVPQLVNIRQPRDEELPRSRIRGKVLKKLEPALGWFVSFGGAFIRAGLVLGYEAREVHALVLPFGCVAGPHSPV